VSVPDSVPGYPASAPVAGASADQRLELLALAGEVLARSLDRRETLDAIARTVVPRIADWCRVDVLEFRNCSPRHADWPRQDLYVRFRKLMLASEEENMLAIPRKQRAMVRKGIKNGLRCEIDSNLDRFFPLYADNMHRHGTIWVWSCIVPAGPRKLPMP